MYGTAILSLKFKCNNLLAWESLWNGMKLSCVGKLKESSDLGVNYISIQIYIMKVLGRSNINMSVEGSIG